MFREVKAKPGKGKVVRAEPISVLFEQNKVSLVGRFPELEDQLCNMTVSGYVGRKSPDRADAMIWGLTELFSGITRAHRTHIPKVVLAYANAKRRH